VPLDHQEPNFVNTILTTNMKNFEDHQPTPVPNPPAPASVTNPIESDPNTTISSEFSPAVPDPVQKEDFEPVATEQAMPSPGTAGHSSSRVTQAPGALAAPSTPRAASSKNKKKKLPSSIPVSGPSSNSQTTSHGAAGENTGRWTAEEHRLFLQGLEQHGKGWKKIASLIKSRTVVQIRTHAQKYFQKLAKARQNGEEGDVPMEGRGGSVSAPPVSSSAAQTTKRRRQTSGTKRKAIQSVVSSAQRQAKKHAGGGKKAPAPAVAPALSHFVSGANNQNVVPSVTTAQGTISGPALEDSL
jgi:SHAQKYF class myb-like DNA-binding protein